MRRPRVWKRRTLAALLLLCVAGATLAQGEPHVLPLDDGSRIEYTLRSYPADAHRLDPAAKLSPTDALSTAKLVTRELAAGRLEAAALLSNAPKARYARLRESFGTWGKADFERVFGGYFAPQNRIVALAAIGRHCVLMWYLKDRDYLTAYFFVEVDGKVLLDDVPSETRTRLHRVLEAYRARTAAGAALRPPP
jgi:hypothetical protein